MARPHKLRNALVRRRRVVGYDVDRVTVARRRHVPLVVRYASDGPLEFVACGIEFVDECVDARPLQRHARYPLGSDAAAPSIPRVALPVQPASSMPATWLPTRDQVLPAGRALPRGEPVDGYAVRTEQVVVAERQDG